MNSNNNGPRGTQRSAAGVIEYIRAELLHLESGLRCYVGIESANCGSDTANLNVDSMLADVMEALNDFPKTKTITQEITSAPRGQIPMELGEPNPSESDTEQQGPV